MPSSTSFALLHYLLFLSLLPLVALTGAGVGTRTSFRLRLHLVESHIGLGSALVIIPPPLPLTFVYFPCYYLLFLIPFVEEKKKDTHFFSKLLVTVVLEEKKNKTNYVSSHLLTFEIRLHSVVPVSLSRSLRLALGAFSLCIPDSDTYSFLSHRPCSIIMIIPCQNALGLETKTKEEKRCVGYVVHVHRYNIQIQFITSYIK